MDNKIKEPVVEYPYTEGQKVKMVLGGLLIFFFLFSFIVLFFCSCTLSFQNISTHGTATDLVDEEQTATPKTDITASIPAL